MQSNPYPGQGPSSGQTHDTTGLGIDDGESASLLPSQFASLSVNQSPILSGSDYSYGPPPHQHPHQHHGQHMPFHNQYPAYQALPNRMSPFFPPHGGLPYAIDEQGGPLPPAHFQGYQRPLAPPHYGQQGMHGSYAPPSAWQTPPMSPSQSYYGTHSRHHSFTGEMAPQSSPLSTPGPPSAFASRQSYGPSPGWNTARAPNRRSWSGPPREADKERERKAYHPQAPAHRSDWVMWVGNVPPNTSHEELWRFFNKEMPVGSSSVPWKGPSSIFLISRSSCAFVNLSSQDDLDQAVAYFNNKSLRPWDARCPRLVCRIRRKDDDLRAGVGAQRGTGMHRDWIKQQEHDLAAAAVADGPVDHHAVTVESIGKEPAKHQSSASFASTNSSFLTRNFPRRIFILKSASKSELEESVKKGTWRTQKHNEPILDQAFRTSPDVFLILGANKTGEFFGFAKMIEHIDKEKFQNSSQSSKGSKGSKESKESKGSGSFPRPEQIKEEDGEDESRDQRASSEPVRPSMLVLPTSEQRITASSPGELTPALEEEELIESDMKANSAPVPPKPKTDIPRSKTMLARSTVAKPAYFDVPPKEEEAEKDEENPPGADGVRRRDTISPPPPVQQIDDGEELGREFAIQWVKIGPLPFTRTRHLRNPWNADREVKISRDGTEVEPIVAALLMAEWDKLPSTITPVSASEAPTYASVQRP